MEEIWKDIIGYEGIYQISNFGIVKSLKFNKEKILKYGIDTGGYKFICLYTEGESKTTKIHRLVGLMFISNPDNKPYINHIDGDKLNNNDWNLEWCTASENNLHAYKLGLIKNPYFITKKPQLGKFGKEHNCAKKIIQYTSEFIFIKKWDSIIDIKKELKIDSISRCCQLKRKTAGGFIWRYDVSI